MRFIKLSEIRRDLKNILLDLNHFKEGNQRFITKESKTDV